MSSSYLSIHHTGILVSAVEGCGRPAFLVSPGDTICLPGSELLGCANVKSFNSNPKCKFYVLQPGESIASIAIALNLYQLDIEAANPDIIKGNLQVGDLIRLPKWSRRNCGELPVNMEQLVLSSSPPPPLALPPTPIDSTPNSPNPNNTLTTLQAPPGQADAEKCRGFRVREFDDLFTIASLFVIEVTQLVTVNPDLASGIPMVPGMVVKIPPYDPTCVAPVLIDAETLLAAPPSVGENETLVALRPVNEGTPAAKGPARAPIPALGASVGEAQASIEGELMSPTDTPIIDNDDVNDDESGGGGRGGGGGGRSAGADFGLGGADTIAADESYLQNIVKDGGNSNAPPAPQSGSNTGNIIMGTTIFVVCIALLGILGMAFSGTGGLKLSSKNEAAPEIV
jgi:hypothetical protein